jgi:hypothetical protein
MSFFLLKKAHIYLCSLEVSISLRIAWVNGGMDMHSRLIRHPRRVEGEQQVLCGRLSNPRYTQHLQAE